ncbi:DNA-binding transcriptional regulator, GntR family [Rhizobiales bacterium GAS191]|nr:DNA-binding transcriptional regulator, GntR family [Rhizobiales bacterium GAS191]
MNSISTDADRDTGPLLALATYGRLRAMLLTGELAGGQVIQERRLAEQLGSSRTPVRDALGRLEGEGLVIRNGRYLLVATVSVDEVLEILSVRRSLEADAVSGATDRMPPAQIEAIRAAISGMSDPFSVTDDEHWANDDLLHLSIADASGNRLLARLIRDLRQRTRMFGLRRIPSRFEAGKREHVAILDAIAARRAGEAAALMQSHIDHARDAIIASLTRTARA